MKNFKEARDAMHYTQGNTNSTVNKDFSLKLQKRESGTSFNC